MHIVLLIWACSSSTQSSYSYECPSGLVPIPIEQPTFCIHPYEGSLDVDGTVTSRKGQVPSVNVSLEDAIRACESTLSNGQRLRLTSIQEWRDAGDGVLGDNGHPFPWGAEKDDSRCVIDSPAQPSRWTNVQPSGSMESCVSQSGVYDQIGNAWEWVDLNQVANRADWMTLVQQQFSTTVSEESIEIETRLLPRLRLQTICVDFKRMSIDTGELTVELNSDIATDCESGGKGYLWFNQSDPRHEKREIPVPGSLLPIRIDGNKIVWDKSRDGESVGAKVGGSFYSGAQMTLQDFWIGHIPSFNGSIGFRCSSDLLKSDH